MYMYLDTVIKIGYYSLVGTLIKIGYLGALINKVGYFRTLAWYPDKNKVIPGTLVGKRYLD